MTVPWFISSKTRNRECVYVGMGWPNRRVVRNWYSQRFTVEFEETDAMGEARWLEEITWDDGGKCDDATHMLLCCVVEILDERRDRKARQRRRRRAAAKRARRVEGQR